MNATYWSILIFGSLGYLVYWLQKDTKRLYKIGKIVKDFFLPTDITSNPDEFTRQQLKALGDKRTISKLLFYRSYLKDDESDLAFFQMHDGRAAIIFKVTPPVFLGEKTENTIINLLTAIVSDDTIVHINTLAGRDISEILAAYDRSVNYDKLNLKHPERVRQIAETKRESFEKWVEESIMGNDADFRVRNFTHVVSVLFPVGLERDKLIKQANEIYGILKDHLSAVVADDKEIVSFVQEILDPSRKVYPKTEDPITTINKRMSRGAEARVDSDDGTIHLKNGWMAKVLTTEKYPKSVDAFSFQSIFFDPYRGDYQIKLPCPFHLSLTIRFNNVEKERKKVLKRAKWNVGQLAPFAASVIEKRDPELKERRKEAEAVIEYINYFGEIPLEANLSLTIYENDKNRLEQYSSRIRSSFDTYPGRWVVREEKFSNIAFLVMMMGIPANYSEAIHSVIDKFDKNFKSNNAQMVPLIGDFKGMGENPTHFYIGGTGQLQAFDVFASKENYNHIIVGPMGTGKSFFTNNFLFSGLKSGWQIRMIDFGRSYLKISEDIGGQFVEFTKEADICLNFFTNLLTKSLIDENGIEKKIIDPEEFESIVPIIGLMMGVGLKDIYKSEDSSSLEKLELSVMSAFIIEAVNIVFERHGHEGGMKEVGEVLDEMRRKKLEENNNIVNEESELLAKMYTSLLNYSSPTGQFFKYFNGPNNINLKSSYFTLELDDISSSPMMPVVAMSFLQKTAQEAFIEYAKDKTTSRIIGVDEAHKILGNEVFAKFFDDFGRRIRKYRGIPMLITQSIEDFNVNRGAEVFFELATFKIFLKQKMESINKAIKKGIISLTPHAKKLMSSVNLRTPYYNEFYMKYVDLDFVSLLKVNGLEYWSYTSNPMDRAKIDKIMDEYNISMRDAVYVLGKVQEGVDIDKALYQLSLENAEKGVKDWDSFFKYAIEKEQVLTTKQDIYCLSVNKKKKEYRELFMRVRGKDGVLHNPQVFMVAAKEKGYSSDLSRIFLNKVSKYIKNDIEKDISYSINVDYDDISNPNFINSLLNLFRKVENLPNKKIFIEIELTHDQKEHFKELMEFAKKIKEIGIDIAFDNVLLEDLDFKSLMMLEPKYLKISMETIRNIINVESNSFLKLLEAIMDITDIRIIATKVENEKDLEDAKFLGIHCFQGYYISKTENILE